MKNRFLAAQLLALSLAVAAPLSAQPGQPGQPAQPGRPPESRGDNPPGRPGGLPPPPQFVGGESRELAESRLVLEHMLKSYGENHPSVVAQQEKIAILEKLEPRRINLNFPGGSLVKLVAAISGSKDVSLNIVNAAEPADLAVELPAFELRNATVRTIASVVRNLLLPRGYELEAMDPEPNAIICTLRRVGPGRAGFAASPEFESHQLAPYLGLQSVDDIIDAIRTAWELDGNHDRNALKLKFHPATSILLVAGPTEALRLTRNVIAQLKQSPGERDPNFDRRPKGPPPPENDKR